MYNHIKQIIMDFHYQNTHSVDHISWTGEVKLWVIQPSTPHLNQSTFNLA